MEVIQPISEIYALIRHKCDPVLRESWLTNDDWLSLCNYSLQTSSFCGRLLDTGSCTYILLLYVTMLLRHDLFLPALAGLRIPPPCYLYFCPLIFCTMYNPISFIMVISYLGRRAGRVTQPCVRPAVLFINKAI